MCFSRGPSPPSAGVIETLVCSSPAVQPCTWCVWNTGWPAFSSCASRASPAPCERRRTWENSTCLLCSALMLPLLSSQPSRWAVVCTTWSQTTVNSVMFSFVQESHSLFPLFILASNPWPQQHPRLCQLSHLWERETPLHHEESRRQSWGGWTLLHSVPGVFGRAGAHSERKTDQQTTTWVCHHGSKIWQ